MADHAGSTTVIDAPPKAIMDVIADFDAYPQWAGPVKSCQVLETGSEGRARRVRFDIDAKVVQDTYVLAYDWSGDEKVVWHLTEGKAQKSQDGSYVLTPQGASTLVAYDLTVELTIKLPGLIRRRVQASIVDTALKDLKKRVEGRPTG